MSSSTASTPLGFQELGLSPALQQILEQLGFTTPTPVQQQALPPMLAGQDVLAQAATGTGKTAAFGLPMVQRLTTSEQKRQNGSPRGLVLTPTRELASQVAQVLRSFTTGSGLHVGCITGGQSMSEQLRALRNGLDIVVATPGRLCDHIDRKSISLQAVMLVILDEADEMLDKGFAEDLDRILSQLPQQRHIGLFSATLPPRMEALARKHMHEPVRIHLNKTQTHDQQLSPHIEQIAYLVESGFKQAALARILHVREPSSAIVFCHTRDEVDQLVHHLSQRGIGCAALHGGLSQQHRDKVLQRFRKGHLPLLIATDVAARGLDVDHVSHVINYAIPGSFETYVHRIGRTGRAGRQGVALTLLSPRERRWPHMLKRACGAQLTLEPIPTGEQLRTQRLTAAKSRVEQLRSESCDESLMALAETLTDNAAEARWAAVALQLAQNQQGSPEDFVHIPTVNPDHRSNERLSDAGYRQGNPRGGRRSFGDRREGYAGRGERRPFGDRRERSGGERSGGGERFGRSEPERFSSGGTQRRWSKGKGTEAPFAGPPFRRKEAHGRNPYGSQGSFDAEQGGGKSRSGANPKGKPRAQGRSFRPTPSPSP